MPALTPKEDGHCSFPSCQEFCDFHIHDKPPAGWAHATLNRYGKGGQIRHVTYLLCPKHSIIMALRQGKLPSAEREGLTRAAIVSPYAGDVETNLTYLRDAMNDAFACGFAPYAPHGLYTQKGVLDDNKPEERRLGILAGHEWMEAADKVLVYADLGTSMGMNEDIRRAEKMGKPVEKRSLKKWKGYQPQDKRTKTEPKKKPLRRSGSEEDA